MNVFCPGCGARFSVASSPIDPDNSATCPKCKSKFSTAGVTETAERLEPKRKLKPKKTGNSWAGVAIAAVALTIFGGTAAVLYLTGVFSPSTAPSRGVPSSQPGWREYTSVEGRFRVMLPGNPERRVRPKKDVEFSLEMPDYRVGVVYADLGDKDKPEKFMVAPAKSKIRNEKEITVGDYKGRDLVVEIGPEVAHMRYVSAGKRLYTVLIVGKNGKQPSDADLARLLDSFQVTG